MGRGKISRFPAAAALAALLWLFPGGDGARAATIEAINDESYAPRAMEIINGARESLRLAIFQVRRYPRHPRSPSNLLLEALVAAAGRGVDVRVCVDHTEAAHLGDNNVRNLEVARHLEAGGVKVFLSPAATTMHAKFLVADRQVLIIGSANWSFYALTRNREANLLVRCPETASVFHAYFEKLQREGRPLPGEG